MTDLAREYGEGLFLLCRQEGLIDPIEDDLQSLCSLFSAQPEYLRLLSSRAIPRAERLNMCAQALRGQVHEYTLNFVRILIERGALNELKGCLEHFHARALEEKGLVEARVVTARPLTPAQKAALEKRLSALSGKRALLQVTVDPSVIGGLRVDIEDKRYDNTIQHRMALLKRHLTEE